ncbi:MAG TPA: cytidine deaminase [Elusimicrobiota bacterium]|nr:cytidine deaminase [Elusimicrobiota bacterium]
MKNKNKKPLTAVYRRLLAAAKAARQKAYAPYSRYRVGAAVLTFGGKIHAGCNVENASYGLTCCAERVAIFKAVSVGERRLRAVAIVLDAPSYGAPCGACRQVIYEFGPAADVLMGTVRGGVRVQRIGELLPLAFGPAHLKD